MNDKEITVAMDNEDRYLLVSCYEIDDSEHVELCFDNGENADEIDFTGVIKLSKKEAENLWYCLERVMNWDQEFEDKAAGK